eukprot:CAMPEP_0119283662 /NCGR_PEP_ID=MMETSP1329-20130426/28903_1 /TAXON_ID=114041 /ORGANISM="Genus nov. species nov., Strain RCC1024" /LENGTH=195 /DNA_ID=CAMNT_0007284337 /DNA_START=164 /DNA_END=748 /DNA_ORIENTATION=-
MSAIYARHAATRPRQDLPWSPGDVALAPLLGRVVEVGPCREPAETVVGAALAGMPPVIRETYLYHSGRAPLPAGVFALPDEVLRCVFDALAPVARVEELQIPEGWLVDRNVFEGVLRSQWMRSFALSSAIDGVAAVRPLSEVSRSWRDALREPMQVRRALLGEYQSEKTKSGRAIGDLQMLYHSLVFPGDAGPDS